MANTTFLALVVSSMFLNLVIYTPILLYWILKVMKFRNSFVIKKRLPTLLITLIVLSIIYFSIEKSIQLCTLGDILSPATKLLLNKMIFYVFQVPFIYFLWFYSLRFWLLFYKLEWSLSMMNNEWKSIIDHHNASNNWFIINRQQYGSLRYLQKKVMFIVSCIIIVVVLSWILYWEEIDPNGYFVWIMYTLLVFGPPTFLLFYVAYKLPPDDDYLGLKDELKYSCYGFIAVILILFIFFAIINSLQDLSSSPYLSLLLWHVVVLWNFSMISLHTYWVVRRFNPVLRRTRYSDASLFSDINKVNNNNAYDAQQQNMNKATYKLHQILSHPKAYDAFMHHLWKEHSSETLLSCTEFIQFQYLILYFQQMLDINNMEQPLISMRDLIELHPQIPQSSIVFGENPSNRISKYIHEKINPAHANTQKAHKLTISASFAQLTRNIIKALPQTPKQRRKSTSLSGKKRSAADLVSKKKHSRIHSAFQIELSTKKSCRGDLPQANEAFSPSHTEDDDVVPQRVVKFTALASVSVENKSSDTDLDVDIDETSVIINTRNSYTNGDTTHSNNVCILTPTIKPTTNTGITPVPFAPLPVFKACDDFGSDTDLEDDGYPDIDGLDANKKVETTHKRTISGLVRDKISGLIQSTRTHKRTMSFRVRKASKSKNKMVFRDDDSDTLSASISDESESEEDSVVTFYKTMTGKQRNIKRLELTRKYREIAYNLWMKYIRVRSEYEINIDFATRKRFAKLMQNKDEWLDNETFNEKELMMMFHQCVQMMFTFLSTSFTRFRDNVEFDRVQEFMII